MAELHVYDFDGTLFKSPEPPESWTQGEEWWSSPESLGPPCVPEHPGPEWWVGSMVASAKKSIANPNVWAILCTGRWEKSPARFRIPELLRGAGMNFDDVFLSPGNETTTFKKRILWKLLTRLPNIKAVHIWDDTPKNLTAMKDLVEKMGIPCFPHLAKRHVHEPLCQDMADRVASRWLSKQNPA